MNKRELPLEILEMLQPYLNDNGRIFDIIHLPGNVCVFKDSNKDSNFMFAIKSIAVRDGKTILDSEVSPTNEQSTSKINVGLPIEAFNVWFSKWIERIKKYDELKFIDDPIVTSYQDDYFAEFHLADDPDQWKPLKPSQFLILDRYLENIIDQIQEFSTVNNVEIIQSIIQDSNELRESITTLTKNEVVKKLAKIWAKITKAGVSVFKEFLSEAKKEIITKGVQYLANHSTEIINKVIHLNS